MSDLGPWSELIHVARQRVRDIWTGKYTEGGYFSEYTMVPLNAYQMGNLMDALLQAEETGDWYGEFCDIIAVAMEKSNLTEVSSNRGQRFTLDEVRGRLNTKRKN